MPGSDWPLFVSVIVYDSAPATSVIDVSDAELRTYPERVIDPVPVLPFRSVALTTMVIWPVKEAVATEKVKLPSSARVSSAVSLSCRE